MNVNLSKCAAGKLDQMKSEQIGMRENFLHHQIATYSLQKNYQWRDEQSSWRYLEKLIYSRQTETITAREEVNTVVHWGGENQRCNHLIWSSNLENSRYIAELIFLNGQMSPNSFNRVIQHTGLRTVNWDNSTHKSMLNRRLFRCQFYETRTSWEQTKTAGVINI